MKWSRKDYNIKILTSTFVQKSILSDHNLSSVELIEHVSNVRLECERDEAPSNNRSLRVPSSICEKIFKFTQLLELFR